MNLRRAVQCGALVCLITLAVPSIAHANDDLVSRSRTTQCVKPSERAATVTELPSGGNNMILQQESDRGHDSRDTADGYRNNLGWWFWFWYWYWYWHHRDHCVPAPPADVPEAPQVLMLSGSAALTGGAAMLIIRRRSRRYLTMR
jgi:hypothetical protein